MHLDKILLREFELMRDVRDLKVFFPMILLMNGHAKMRVAFELGCSACLSEAHSIMRDAIESVAHAHRIAADPNLLKVWIEKNDGKDALDLFKKEFEQDKTKKLFSGLPELHGLWKQFSEFGSHTNLNSIVERFGIEQTATHLQYLLNYTGVKPELLAQALFQMILASNLMENVVFKLCEGRLKLDLELPRMRAEFEREKEAVRARIIKQFNVRPPTSHP